ncbi:neurogenic locus Notch protein-like [Saccostrea cucullata]|uniref:neurogenic locus Notch protein-like n=1 Tax=Saccostrea cuccullata TaxID=36930 RepID=UPI002ECFCBEB
MVSFQLLFSFMWCMFYSGGKGKNCSEYFNPQEKIISNLLSDMTTSNETCNYEIIAPVGQHVEILFDVNFRNQRRCSPMSTADYGIFISYTHTDQTRYYDVICDKKSAYLVRSVGRRLYLKFIINHVPFTYHGIYRFVPSTNCIMFQCLNGGTCIVTNGQRFCICSPGFSGFTCSECANFRCYNGGSCIMSKNNKPHCVCGINFEGRFCERNRNPCLSNPCLFGRCEIITSSDTSISSKTDGNEYSLPTGYNNLTNVTSKHIIYDQLNDILQEESHDSFQCTCYSGYSGVRCDQITEKCDSHSCLVHKECT